MVKKKRSKVKESDDPIEGAFIFRHQHGWTVEKIAEHYAVDARTIRRWLALYKDKASRYWTKLRHTRARKKHYGPEIVEKVRQLKETVPARSAVIIHKLLAAEKKTSFPSKETVRRILRDLGYFRHKNPGRKSYIKFERDFPNELWHVDFKGCEYFGHLGKLHLLAIMDDRSRFVVAARWCKDQEETNVLSLLREAFEIHGLPNEILSDNGSQFRNSVGDPATKYYRLLLLLGVNPIYHQPNHPQTKGKIERWFGTVKNNFAPDAHALVSNAPDLSFREFNDYFASWIEWYNTKHEHSSLDGKSPATVYNDDPRRINRPLLVAFNWNPWLAIVGTRNVTKQDMISVDGTKYILPSGYAGTRVQIRKLYDKIEIYSNEILVKTFQIPSGIAAGADQVNRVTFKGGTFSYKRRIYAIGYKNGHKVVTIQETANGKELLIYHDGELLARVNIRDGTEY